MKKLTGFLIVALALTTGRAYCTPVATTAGSNLTAYNPGSGAINNNTWNNMMNGRSGGGTGAVADFGNCNSLILRCASPKCANGGCVDVSIARPIVAGCVAANSACKQYGDDLIDTLAAQLVANSIAKSNDAANAAAESAAAAAAQQSAQQIQQMQMQMQQMQSQMAAQNAETVAQLQAALDEQKQMAAQREAEAAAASAKLAQQNASGLTAAQEAAAANGVSSDVLVRNQISGQIMTEIENAEKQLNEMKAVMERAFEYAGCDASGNNCTGPARVKRFKEIASEFFAPYENTLDAVYDALVLAQTVGVDISDIYMMLNDSCNSWGKYLCSRGQQLVYSSENCADGISAGAKVTCQIGQIIPMSDNGCQFVGLVADKETIFREWDYDDGDTSAGSRVLIGCASAALDNSTLFKGRRKKSSIDIEILQRILQQDAPASFGASTSAYLNSRTPYKDGLKYCAVGVTGYEQLQAAVASRKLPTTVCVSSKSLVTDDSSLVTGDDSEGLLKKCQIDVEKGNYKADMECGNDTVCILSKCACEQYNHKWVNGTCDCGNSSVYNKWDSDGLKCVNDRGQAESTSNATITYASEKEKRCKDAKGAWNKATGECSCPMALSQEESAACQIRIQEINNGVQVTVSSNNNALLKQLISQAPTLNITNGARKIGQTFTMPVLQ